MQPVKCISLSCSFMCLEYASSIYIIIYDDSSKQGCQYSGSGGYSSSQTHEWSGEVWRQVLVGTHVATVDGPIESHSHTQHHHHQGRVAVHEAHSQQTQHGTIYSWTHK